jgi:hypothetical protein
MYYRRLYFTSSSSLLLYMVTKTIPAIVAIVAVAVMIIATLLPLTMAVTPAFAQDPQPNEEDKKVTICHVPPGNPDNAHEITVGESAAKEHLTQHEGDRTVGDDDKKC